MIAFFWSWKITTFALQDLLHRKTGSTFKGIYRRFVDICLYLNALRQIKIKKGVCDFKTELCFIESDRIISHKRQLTVILAK